jgi:hypothetical protein
VLEQWRLDIVLEVRSRVQFIGYTRRVLEIAQVGELPKDRVAKALKETGLLTVVPDTHAEIHF